VTALAAAPGVAALPGGEEGLRVAGHLAERAWLADCRRMLGDPFGQQRGLEAADDHD